MTGPASSSSATSPAIPLSMAERNVPRYTSYPTAPHFHAGINAATYAQWLKALPHDARLSLYLHVPYCHSICLYCGCHTKAVRRFDPIKAYTRHLMREVEMIGALVPQRKVTHWHWGGGTPSIIGPALMREVVAKVRDHFDLTALQEHAIELDPRHLDDEMIAALTDCGINRVSLGVQDFAPHVQEAIGRIQPFEQVRDVVTRLRKAGIANINIDLMYGLPLQTIDDVRTSARLAASLSPQRLALFGYAHVPWFKSHQKVINEADLPGVSERIVQADAAAQIFTAAGYDAIGLDHFARPEDDLAIAAREQRLHRNFQGYTTDEADALLGLGASSISRLPQGHVQNAVDMGSYGRAIAGGRLATIKGLAFSDDDKLRGAIIERLMCDMRVDLDAFACATKAQMLLDGARLRLDELEQAGIVTREGHVISMTKHGRALTRLAAAAFDSWLTTGAPAQKGAASSGAPQNPADKMAAKPARHSRAV